MKDSKFEQIKKVNEIGQEYWSARELQEVLEYTKWDKFLNVIEKAKIACNNSGIDAENHFPPMEKLVEIGSGAIIEIKGPLENLITAKVSVALICRTQH